MKIDTTLIPGFDALPDEAKNAILGMEFDDAPDMSQFVAKSVFDKKASEAAELGKQLKSKLTEDEQKAIQQQEEMAAIKAEVETLRKEKAETELTNRWMGIGYPKELAVATAKASADGDMDTVFKNHAKFLADREKALKSELLKNTPTPPAGDGDKKITKEDFSKMTLAEKQKFATENPEAYREIYTHKEE